MSSLTSTINVNVNSNIKKKANNILNDLGLNMSTAINIFLTQVVKRKGIPFEVRNPEPSEELLEALREADDIRSGKIKTKGYRNVNQMFEDILHEDDSDYSN